MASARIALAIKAWLAMGSELSWGAGWGSRRF
jgi:hypothetical protein